MLMWRRLSTWFTRWSGVSCSHFSFLRFSLHDTRMEKKQGVTETQKLTPRQWQLLMKCWKLNLRPGQYSWWGPMAWRIGSLVMWLYKLRKVNGPNFTWPLFMFSGAISEKNLERMGKIYRGKP